MREREESLFVELEYNSNARMNTIIKCYDENSVTKCRTPQEESQLRIWRTDKG